MFRRLRHASLTIAQLWPLIVVAGVFAIVSTHPVRPHDFWWHLRAGQEIVRSGSIPTVDAFSYTMVGAPYDNFASFWLVEVVYYFLYRLGALPLIICAHAVVVTTAYTIILRLGYQITRDLRLASAGALFAAALGVENWNVRPQAVGYLLFSLCLWAIWTYRRRPRGWLLIVPPVAIALWANCHGSFFLGFVLLGAWLVDALWVGLSAGLRSRLGSGARVVPPLALARIPAMLLVASTLATLLNPRGPRVFSYIGSITGNAVIRNLVVEWRPPGLDSFNGVVFIAALLFVAVQFAVSPRRPGLFALLIYVVFALLALSASRSVVWFGLALAPLVAQHLGKLATQLCQIAGFGPALGRRAMREPRNRTSLNLTIAAILILGTFFSLPWFKHLLPLPEAKARLVSTETPVEAVRLLIEQHLPRQLFHDEATGSYLTWAASEYPVFVDTRFELYPRELWDDYLRVSAAETGWEDRLEGFGVNTLLLNRESQGALSLAASGSLSWRVVYEDAYSVLLTRK